MRSQPEVSQCSDPVRFVFVHEWVRRQSELHPDRAAIVDASGRRVGYGELLQRSGRLAGRLRVLGVRADDCVAVYMERSVELIVSMLAILEAGGVYVPLDPSDPERRTGMVIERLRPALIVAERDVPGRIDVPVIRSAAHDAQTPEIPAGNLDADNLAYVIHTSGSTGAPKGICMSHSGLSRLIRWQVQDGLPRLSTLQFTSPGFDVSFQEIFSTLCSGGTLHLVSDSLRRDPERLLQALEDKAIQRLFLPYVALQQLAKAFQRAGVVPTSLRHLITAGERLIVTAAIADLFRALPHCRLDNHYGPSEAHLVTSYTLPRDRSAWPTVPPIGRPVDGVVLYNLDSQLAPVAPGDSGELYVGGDGLARGYLGAPELTAEKFSANPLQREDGARLYRTGDLARVDGEGFFHFLGRSDDQLKVRGFRVEPTEVELALTDHPHVREAAVVPKVIADDVTALVAFVVADDFGLKTAELSQDLRSSLPSYMVPAYFVRLDALPLTSSGKVDRRALRGLDHEPAAEEIASEQSLLETVRRIWVRILDHDELELDDDFFDVGGDSMLAAWVVAEIGQVVGREVELSVLLRNSTIAGIAEALSAKELKQSSTRRESEIVSLRAGPAMQPLFLVHPLGGELLAYRELARSIQSPLRVLGLRWRPEDSAGAAVMPLEKITAIHLAQLRTVQPNGPYLLAGWSFGGVLAFELAQQLTADQEQVDFLGLIDANPLRDPITGCRMVDSPQLGFLTKALEELERSTGVGDDSADLSRLFAGPSLDRLIGESVPEGVTAAHLKKNLQIARANMQAATDYHPVPYAGLIDLFQAEASSKTIQESLAMELRSLALAPIRVHMVPGDHFGMLHPPHVLATARALDAALNASSSQAEHDDRLQRCRAGLQ